MLLWNFVLYKWPNFMLNCQAQGHKHWPILVPGLVLMAELCWHLLGFIAIILCLATFCFSLRY